MRTVGGGILLVVSIVLIVVDGLIAGLFFFNAVTPASPNPDVLPTDRSGLIPIGLFFAALSALGVFGTVELIRRGSAQWPVTMIVSSLIAWFFLFNWALQGLDY